MSGSSKQAKKVSLTGDFDRVTFRGTTLEFRGDAGLFVTTDRPKVEVFHTNDNRTMTAIGAVLEARDIGRMIEGEGVYFGVWTPAQVGKTYDVFTDVKDLMVETFNQTVKTVAGIRGLHGHDGRLFKSDAAVYKSLAKGYKGEWFTPTKELVHGRSMTGKPVQADNLSAHKDKGDLAGTFKTSASGSGFAHWYWSCTEHRDDSSEVYAVAFTGGVGGWVPKDKVRLSSRVVRAKLRPSGR